MPPLSDRLKAALSHAGISGAELARRIGLSKGAVGHWMTGHTRNIEGDNLVRAAAVLGVRARWLIEGTGPMLAADGADEGRPAASARTPSGRRWVSVRGEGSFSASDYWIHLQPISPKGNGAVLSVSQDPNAYAIRCIGEGLAPRFQHGEFAIVEPAVSPQPGDEVLLQSRTDAVQLAKLLYERDGRLYLQSVSDPARTWAIERAELARVEYVSGMVKSRAWQSPAE